ncbi:MAG: bifunctional proline dehydrogenase/L-glutamate gamma-semialdehyde dehydrogenase [Acidimicrobiaceae bacterium]|nr:bifunctional proline dehydrogenase/L-glutamate gamma-semialdehyde dehydrogenase [Acidimicrobiaceae bacterium]
MVMTSAENPVDPAALVDDSIALVAGWLQTATSIETRSERGEVERLHALIDEPAGVHFAMQYIDRVARHADNVLAANELATLARNADLPGFVGPVDRALLHIGAHIAPLAPRIVMPFARRRLRQLVGHMLVDADPTRLHRHMSGRREQGVALNLNLLGEAVLGEGEAERRFQRTLDLIADPAVTYVSVKASAVASQIDLWSYDDSLTRVMARLRQLLSAGAAAQPSTFINLDMEEYKDLHLTLDAFTSVLDESDHLTAEAGIVLQTYLPDSFGALQRLTDWATRRRERGGAAIKVRLVKGANLAMERVDAAMHNWDQAPYATKADVDANYKRCVEWAVRPEHTAAVRVGVASHNLFDVAWAKLLVEAHGVAEHVDFEMLQGMAPSHARAVQQSTNDLLLYTPIVAPADFDVAISYLIRRLEENASGDNFLRHLFAMSPTSASFHDQADRFRRAVAGRNAVSAEPHRRGRLPAITSGFANHPDTDTAQPAVQDWLVKVRELTAQPVRAALTTSISAVDQHLATARATQPGWLDLGAVERRRILWAVADELENRRDEFLSTMAYEGRKVFAEADVELSEAIDFARWYGDHGAELESTEGASFAPYGVITVVPPWNFPVAIPTGGVMGSLASGNTVILKPAPETPRCAELIVEAAHTAGVPPGALQFVRTPDNEVGQALVTGSDAVIVTGSTETAKMFRRWRPDLPVLAETSGKNALVITPHADIDQAVGDLVKSAFGHTGQKCSAASLAILVGGVADDPRFRRQLMDAVRSLRIGSPTKSGPNYGPTILAPEGTLTRALEHLDEGESWLVEPKQQGDADSLWSPGVREGVAPGSWFHQTECFGPVLGLIRAESLEEAIRIQNDSDFGLTGGLHSLDEKEIKTWLDSVEVGNAYVNRGITGAIVRRQPFGGWKGSSVGLGAKAGGSDYLLQLGRWTSTADLADAPESDRQWHNAHYGIGHDPSALFCERNELRYLPHPTVVIRASADADPAAVRRAVAAAERVNTSTTVSDATTESDDDFIARLINLRWGRIRMIGYASDSLRLAAVEHDVHIIDEPVTASGRLELRLYLREQAISQTLHRFGNVPAT